MKKQKQFTITKKIAKHGSNSIIVIPKVLQGELRPKMIVEINIKVLEDIKEVNEDVKERVNDVEGERNGE